MIASLAILTYSCLLLVEWTEGHLGKPEPPNDLGSKGIQSGLVSINCLAYSKGRMQFQNVDNGAPHKGFGGFVLKSNRQRFCPQLLSLCPSEGQRCQLEERHLLGFKIRFLFGGKPKHCDAIHESQKICNQPIPEDLNSEKLSNYKYFFCSPKQVSSDLTLTEQRRTNVTSIPSPSAQRETSMAPTNKAIFFTREILLTVSNYDVINITHCKYLYQYHVP